MQGLFNMTSDSQHFHKKRSKGLLPLYEAKMIHQFDHRFASLIGTANAGNRPSRKYEGWYGVNPADPTELPIPRYWVAEEEVLWRLASISDDERSELEKLPEENRLEQLRARSPRWLLGFRDVTNAVVERSVIFSFLPRAGVGHTMPLVFANQSLEMHLCLCGNFDSLVLDYVARQKIGGTHLTYSYLNQLAVLPPSFYRTADVAYVASRVLELVYTAEDMQPLADALRAGASPLAATVPRAPYRWDEARRALLRAELDAWFARAYGLNRKQLRYILDPADLTARELEDILDPAEEVNDPLDPAGYTARAAASDFPGETFRVLKEKEIAKYGEYRTRRLILEAWDKLPPR
jgi:hypothetical protein